MQRSPRNLLSSCRAAIVPAAAVLAWTLAVGVAGHRAPGTGPLPSFHEIDRVAVRKQQFFDYLTPVIRAENARIRAQRERLLGIARAWRDRGEPPGWVERQLLRRLAREYRVEQRQLDAVLDALLERVDVIPRSLVLVQAAKESGWGSSRFARGGNNLFGQWCFEAGCGLVPRDRPPGGRHEVASFDTVRDSVASYVRNLNTHPSYQPLRALRAELRAQEAPLSGVSLAKGLVSYSERGDAYVREVQEMILQNALDGTGAGETLLSGP